MTIVKTTVGNSGFFINFLIAIGMLFAGLMLTSQLGGAMGKIAGAASSKMQSAGMSAAKWARRKIGPTGMITGGAALLTGGARVAIGMGRRIVGWRKIFTMEGCYGLAITQALAGYCGWTMGSG